MARKAIIKIKYFDEELEKIKKIDIGDWVDLRSAKNIKIDPFTYKLIPLGIAMQLPKGYEAHVVPRSSTFKHFKIIQANSKGIIDNSYCGDNDQWFFPALTLQQKAIIEKNDRICQFRIVQVQPGVRFDECESFDTEDRGGLGSTGKK